MILQRTIMRYTRSSDGAPAQNRRDCEIDPVGGGGVVGACGGGDLGDFRK
jgi:hypothetical protein